MIVFMFLCLLNDYYHVIFLFLVMLKLKYMCHVIITKKVRLTKLVGLFLNVSC